MKYLKHICLMAILLTALVACDSDGGSETDKKHDYSKGLVPLDIGNWWVEKTTFYDIDSKIINTNHDTITVIGFKEMDGHTWFKLYHTKDHFSEWLSNLEDGFYHYSSYQDYLHYKFPLVLGQTFEDYNNTEWSALSLNERIDSNAGLFKCIKFFGTNGRVFDYNDVLQDYITANFESYYCPGLGRVMEKTFALAYCTDTQYLYSVTELESYHLN